MIKLVGRDGLIKNGSEWWRTIKFIGNDELQEGNDGKRLRWTINGEG